MSDLWFEIRWHFRRSWWAYAVAAILILVGLVVWYAPTGYFEIEPSPVTVTVLAEGTIVSVRATGSYDHWCMIELKFESGVVLLTSYQFIQRWNIREGRQYQIQQNSRIGRTVREIE